MFANNEQDGAKGWVVGDSKENTFCFVQCGSVMGRIKVPLSAYC